MKNLQDMIEDQEYSVEETEIAVLEERKGLFLDKKIEELKAKLVKHGYSLDILESELEETEAEAIFRNIGFFPDTKPYETKFKLKAEHKVISKPKFKRNKKRGF